MRRGTEDERLGCGGRGAGAVCAFESHWYRSAAILFAFQISSLSPWPWYSGAGRINMVGGVGGGGQHLIWNFQKRSHLLPKPTEALADMKVAGLARGRGAKPVWWLSTDSACDPRHDPSMPGQSVGEMQLDSDGSSEGPRSNGGIQRRENTAGGIDQTATPRRRGNTKS